MFAIIISKMENVPARIIGKVSIGKMVSMSIYVKEVETTELNDWNCDPNSKDETKPMVSNGCGML